jgi:glutamate--cysteine ligase
MAAPSATDDRVLRAADDLLEPFFESLKPKEQFRIGAEQEKVGFIFRGAAEKPKSVLYEPDGTGAPAVAQILSELVSHHGWHREGDSGPLIALNKAGASVTLEPGAQLELSGAPLDNIHQIDDEMSSHLAELHAISAGWKSRGHDLRWLGIGFNPIASQAELGWVPKARYGVMKSYLPTRGAHGLDMMRRTATVQANFDYPSEEAAMRMLRIAMRISPFVTAAFANSPYYEGALFGGKSFRAKVWLDVDPDRQGLVPRVLDGGTKFVDYVEWALDAPMFLVLRDGGARVVPNTGQTFRDFMANGFEGEKATMNDWLTHINTMFPEVRLKKTLEVRGGDSLPRDIFPALPALWTGILYDDRALAETDALSESYGSAELQELRPHIAKDAVLAPFRGKLVVDVVERLVEISKGGLERRARRGPDGSDERRFLAPLETLVAARQCPADRLIGATARAAWGDRLAPVLL